MRTVSIAAWLGLLGVASGALGAHALRAHLDPAHLEVWQTAAREHLIHAVALAVVGLVQERRPGRVTTASAVAMASGILLFSGSLYALALGAPVAVGWITPLGGVLLLAGWALLALGTARPAPGR